jgi:hypothetical protein
MTEGRILKTLIAIVAIFSLAVASLPAHSQVQQCAEGMTPIADGRLQHAVDALKASSPNIELQLDEHPCRHARDTAKALVRTLGRNYLKGMTGYELAKIVNGEAYFTIERIGTRNPKHLQSLANALNNHRPRKLSIEANTSYDYALVDDGILLMISSAVGREENAKMFEQVRQVFSSSATTNSR